MRNATDDLYESWLCYGSGLVEPENGLIRPLFSKLSYFVAQLPKILRPLFIVALFVFLTGFNSNAQSNLLYFISDSNNTLYTIDRTNGTVTEIGPTGRSSIEALAYYPIQSAEELYAADAGDFGTLNRTTGAFSLIGEIDGGGTANGSAGAQTLNDVDGLMLDGQTLIMWAVERKTGSIPDLLFQINLSTGQFVANAFGAGVDYLEITGTGINVDVDDLAVDPISGDIYGVSNDNGSGDALVKVNKTTGEFEFVTTLAQDDVEGLSFHNDGKLYGSEGDSDNRLSLINPVTGAMTNFYSFSPGSDVEGLAALVAPTNLISGTVFQDDDLDGINDMGETGIANVTVYLYLDQDGDGQVDPEDTRIQTTTTDVNGDYSFDYITTGTLLTRTEFSTYPSGFSLTTDNVETITFTDGVNFGETDANNDFGLGTGTDCDGDGLTDFFEGTGDADGDGILNQCDLDSDNDGIRDDVEGTEDFDNDGIPNYLDRDSDDDGIPDAIEANGGIRPAEYVDLQGNLSGAVGANGIVDTRETSAESGVMLAANPDSDGDGNLDYLDLDSDNDGILDLREAGGTVDVDGDGQVDGLTDVNGNGYDDTLENNPFPVPNTDVSYENTYGQTRLPNYIDIDSDADGIDDTREGLSTVGYRFPDLLGDADGDGILDFWDVSEGVQPIVPVDTDADGKPDYTDSNSDNDPESDFIEGNDADNNGVADQTNTGLDANGNGLDDRFDAACSNTSSIVATDHAEENNSTGAVSLTSTDAELINDAGTLQTVGFYFPSIGISSGAEVSSAYIQFQADEVQTGAITITIEGELSTSAALFSTTTNDVSDRLTPGTTASESWSPADWNTIGEASTAQQTVDITSIVQELINQGGWLSSSPMVLIFTGPAGNRRTAEVNPTLVIQTPALACSSSVSLPDTDGDDEDDFRDFEGVALDTDGDGVPDADDIDDDNDGILDVDESGVLDTDGDGLPNSLDLDSDNDGIPDIIEAGGVDTDNDGRVDSATDTDGDGWANTFDSDNGGTALANPDTDGDGIKNFLDLDSDGDGVVDLIESQATTGTPIIPTGSDSDGDGIDNAFDVTGGTPITPVDTETDGTPDYLDTDSDDDGFSDAVEAWDTDGDGIADTISTGSDLDQDGLDNAFDNVVGPNSTTNVYNNEDALDFPDVTTSGLTSERDWREDNAVDSDGDGQINSIDIDDDDDGILDVDEGVNDFDNDGIMNSLDLDSDNDGIPDIIEAGGVDSNNDGRVDDNTDTDNDGWADTFDSDNGGTALAEPDTDSDGLKNFVDVDSDGDGIVDLIESQATTGSPNTPSGTDTDQDGLDNTFDINNGGTPTTPVDTDTDLTPDYIDANSDNDGFSDILEAWDTDGDLTANVLPSGTDTDNDGLDDAFDDVVGPNNTTNASNSETALSFPDVTTAGNSERDWRESNAADSDFDGIPDSTDIDDDNDGILDVDEACGNTSPAPVNSVESFSVIDGLEIPLVNDGVVATDDGARFNTIGHYVIIDLGFDVASGTEIDFGLWKSNTSAKTMRIAQLASSAVDLGGGTNAESIDQAAISNATVTTYTYTLNADTRYVQIEMTARSGGRIELVEATLGSYFDCTQDTDGDGIIDALDLDSDNDGIPDIIEAGGVDSNNDGRVDDDTDTDGDGWANTFDSNNGGIALINPDSDNDGIKNFLDLDSDNDGIEDIIEGGGVDTNDDGVVDSATDNDGDGWANTFDSDNGGTALTVPDTDSDGLENYIDIDADGDGIVDLIESQATTGTPIIPVGTDTDGDGIDNAFDSNNGGTPVTPVDTELDGTPDYIDFNSDNDSFSDALEGYDTDNDQVANTLPAGLDSDGDGLDDNFDNVVGPNATTNAYNSQDANDFPDVSTSGLTSERDWREVNTLDADFDGIPDGTDIDDDNDGILDVTEGTGDADGDGIPNNLDLDSDNDGIPDIIEAGGVDTDNDGRVDVDTDTDGDGWANTFDSDNGGTALTEPDSDNDGVKNYVDRDSDNDGILDVTEANNTDANGDGAIDGFIDANGDGYDDNQAGGVLILPNSDLSYEDTNGLPNLPNYIDIDSDADGIDDTREGYSTAGYQAPTDFTDTDGDGILDFWDVNSGNSPIDPVDTDGAGLDDYVDENSDNDSRSDFIEGNDFNEDGVADVANTGQDTNGNGLDDAFDQDCYGNSLSSVATSAGEQQGTSVNISSTDLELVTDGANQIVGMYFPNIAINQSETINSAYIQFQVDEATTGTVNLTIEGQLDPNPAVFTTGTNNISLRIRTVADEAWSPADWNNIGEASTDQRTVDISSIIQEIVNQGGWSNGNPLVLIITGPADADTRTAEDNPTLVINFGSGITFCSSNVALQDGDLDGEKDWRDSNGLEAPSDKDADGIPDIDDIDDDNDGILDTDEGCTDTAVSGANASSASQATATVNNPSNGIDGVNANFASLPNDGATMEVVLRGGNIVTAGTVITVRAQKTDNVASSMTVTESTDGISYVNSVEYSFTIDDVYEDKAYTLATDATHIRITYNDVTGDLRVDNVSYPAFSIVCTGNDTDSDGIPDHLDIDADGDGIVDLIESQATTGTPVVPVGVDTDGDGLDDAFDSDCAPCGLVTGVPTVLTDTDGDLTFDFLDFNSDDDTFSDQLEGWDTDGNLVANIVPSGIDADNDGLDDAFDLVAGINSTTNVYNTQDAFDFPDQTTLGNTERDWREQNVADTDLDGIQDSNDIDDDNDGILDWDEGCSTGITEAVAGVDSGGGGVSAGEFPLVNDGNLAANSGLIMNATGEYIIVDLGREHPSGVDIDFVLWKSSTANKEIRFAQLPDNTVSLGGGTNAQSVNQSAIAADPATTTFTYTLNATTRYVQIEMTARSGGRLEIVEGTIQAYDFGCSVDTDGDGVFDGLDLDSDNDGIPDIIEAGGVDANNDGRVDVNTDTDNDGWANTFDSDNGGTALTNPDTDNDGINDYRDLDSDNDGIEDIIEAGGADTNNDGVVDSATDLDGDGWANTFDSDNGGTALAYPDTDGDGLRNNIDIDADGDGIVDLIESQATTGSPVVPGGTDSDSDGIDNAFDVTGGTPTDPVDTDMDGTPDYLDFNSDNDSFLDAQEGYDTDGDLVANILPAGTDADGDGLDDNYDTVVGPNSTTNVYNNEDANDFPDVTTSGLTTERDWREANVLDTDSDGEPDSTDIDDDNDGILDVDEGEVADFDNDGIVNSLDLDSDNDGIPDIIEAGGVDANNDGRVDDDTDTDGDGWANTFDSDNGGTALTDPDTDLDEQANRIDIDSDNDGIVDLIESQATSGTPVVPVGSDLDGDGIDDSFDVNCAPCGGVTGVPTVIVNTDGTDNPDYIDTDSDNDGLADVIEAYDTDGDYLPNETPNGNDDDNDGLDDNFDNVTGPNSTNNATNDQTANTFPDVTTSAVTSERDWRESNAENCQPGGISSNFLLWLRADDGGTSWRDVSNNYVSVSSVGSFTTGGSINFNPTNFFNGSSYYNTTLSVNADTYPDLAVIVVYQPTIDNSGAVWGEDNGSFDRYILDNNGVGENEAVSNGTGLTSNVTGLYSVGTTTISSVLFDEDQASGSTVYINGSNTQTNFTSDHGGETSNTLQIGGLGDATNRFNGVVSEVIVYNSLLTTATDFQQIQSYLAFKYGVTLSSDTDGDAIAFEAGEGDYIASNGSSIFWDASDNTTFHNNVAGIVRDDNSCLNQLQSQSENSDAIVAIGLDDDTDGLEASNAQNGSTFSNDLTALVWGHDGASLYDNDENIDYDPFQVNSRLNREWRVRETNTIGMVTVRFDVSNLLGPTGVGTNDESQIVLLLDANGDFSENAQVVPQAFVVADDGFVSFQVDFSDGQYFTLASSELYALPITLLSFEGTAFDDYVRLDWATLDETDNSLFRIERSGNGTDFETIGYRDGAGTSTSVSYYSFRDESPLESSNYYRLVDIDNNGEENISEIIRVDYQYEEIETKLYPNPASRHEAINVALNPDSQVGPVFLYQSNGTRIPIRSEQLSDRLVILANKASSGLHFLHVEIDGQTFRMKLLIRD